MSKIKIISGWSNPGGSTVAHIALTNLLNKNGFDCTFYGPHSWHLDKCKSGDINDAKPGVHDTLISHFIQIPRLNVKKHILYCHEKEIFPLKDMDLARVDIIAYVSNSQKIWHGVKHESVIIPPMVEKVNWTNPQNTIAGVIGSIDRNKQTHKSVERALDDGFEQVILFGDITDSSYFNSFFGDYEHTGKVLIEPHTSREAMYGRVSKVYHSSLSETYGLVEAECRLSGIPYDGPSFVQEILSDKEILKRWIAILK